MSGMSVFALLLGVAAQQAGAPPRPVLLAGQDTNSADAYVAFGMSQIPVHPKLAGDAFYWATRLDPSSGAAWYGRWAAHLLNPDTPPPGSFTLPGVIEVEAPDVQDPDSLRSKAFLREPLLFLRFDFTIADELMRRQTHGEATLYQTDDPVLRAEIDYNVGRFGEATRSLGKALRSHPGYYRLHIDRARAFAMLSQYDSALTEMQLFLRAAPHWVEHRPVGPDASIPVVEYAMGRLEESKGDLPASTAMYEKLLAISPAFAPAHAALARLALARQDTAVALSELGRATLTVDPPTCYSYGVLLLEAGHTADAAAQFGRALEADPEYALPYYPLAVLEEAAGFDSAAMAHYAQYIARAPRTLAATVDVARARLTHLQGAARPD